MHAVLNTEDAAFLIVILQEFTLTSYPDINNKKKKEFNQTAINVIKKLKNQAQIFSAVEIQVLNVALLCLKITIEDTYPVLDLEARDYLNKIDYFLNIFNILDKLD
ncbi:hypothetical protein [Clostridium perfringens]|uniref:hypothetical protein n=1 Tax=Clostridium perfringens TaxID=1502 RepID=UPI001A250B2D|nr:hypothetical protein [Clostridium perfringens]MCX0363675.1 hypothetical protein [Clostridium perfringens]MDT9337831.1 hypothetical protein [Clostridium perfringens]MDT9345588.1 hypothetical protein [Clostridium perfringens]MDT9347002.1 hypothetical protein [Clostridium perfringens]MDT9354674.1 hypothetical protein [Clostridium perfringens]